MHGVPVHLHHKPPLCDDHMSSLLEAALPPISPQARTTLFLVDATIAVVTATTPSVRRLPFASLPVLVCCQPLAAAPAQCCMHRGITATVALQQLKPWQTLGSAVSGIGGRWLAVGFSVHTCNFLAAGPTCVARRMR